MAEPTAAPASSSVVMHAMNRPSIAPVDPAVALPAGVFVIGLHGAGAAGKSSLLEAIARFQQKQAEGRTAAARAEETRDESASALSSLSPSSSTSFSDRVSHVRHTVFLETRAGLASATAAMEPDRSLWQRLWSPTIQVHRRLFGIDRPNSLMLTMVWNYERQQHLRVQQWIKEKREEDAQHDDAAAVAAAESVKPVASSAPSSPPSSASASASASSSSVPPRVPRESWLWLDRNCVDAAAYCECSGASVVDPSADFQRTLTDQTRQLSCGVWLDTHVDLIREHHRARGAAATSVGVKLVCAAMTTFPSIWLPTVTAVETVQAWYASHGIAFVRISEFKSAHRAELGIAPDADPSAVDIVWNDRAIALLCEFIMARMEEAAKARQNAAAEAAVAAAAANEPNGVDSSVLRMHPTAWMKQVAGWNE